MLTEMTTKELGLLGSITLPIDAGYPGRQYRTKDKTYLYIKKLPNNNHLLGDDINDVINNVDINHGTSTK